MTSRTALYRRGLAEAVAAHNLKLLKEKKSRPVSALWDLADRAKSPAVKRDLNGLAYLAQKRKVKNVSKKELAAAVRVFRTRAIRARHQLAAIKTTGGARASQLRQIRGLSAWIRRSEPRRK